MSRPAPSGGRATPGNARRFAAHRRGCGSGSDPLDARRESPRAGAARPADARNASGSAWLRLATTSVARRIERLLLSGSATAGLVRVTVTTGQLRGVNRPFESLTTREVSPVGSETIARLPRAARVVRLAPCLRSATGQAAAARAAGGGSGAAARKQGKDYRGDRRQSAWLAEAQAAAAASAARRSVAHRSLDLGVGDCASIPTTSSIRLGR